MKIRELLTDESRWTKGEYARDKSGNKVMPSSKEAVSFCLSGALFICESSAEIRDKIIAAVEEKGYCTVSEYNDNSTFEDIRALITELDI